MEGEGRETEAPRSVYTLLSNYIALQTPTDHQQKSHLLGDPKELIQQDLSHLFLAQAKLTAQLKDFVATTKARGIHVNDPTNDHGIPLLGLMQRWNKQHCQQHNLFTPTQDGNYSPGEKTGL